MFKYPDIRHAARTSAGLLVGMLCLAACNQTNTSDDTPAQSSTSHLVQLDASRAGHYGYGSSASEEEISGWDIDIRSDGKGLREGSGSVEDGEWIYEEQCAECHGSFGEGVGRFPVLAGGVGSLRDSRPSKTISSYWPYTSTLYDYIYRAMPFTQPESLSVDETYAVTAYVLYLNDLVEDDFVLNQDNLASIQLPNKASFGPDPRPDVSNTRCMEACRDPAAIEILSETLPAEPSATRDSATKDSATIDSATMDSATRDSATESETGVAGSINGQSIYDQACKLCHDSGLAGAPALGETDQWETRITQGLDSMVSKAISGFSGDTGMMPPKGGFAHLTDEEVRLAVSYMVDSIQ